MNSAVSVMSQFIDLSSYAQAISSGNVSLDLSAWLGGYGNQDDSAAVSVTFLNYNKQSIGSPVNIGPILAADRNYITSLLFCESFSMVPINTVFITVTVTFIRYAGKDCDGYVDNISVQLRRS